MGYYKKDVSKSIFTHLVGRRRIFPFYVELKNVFGFQKDMMDGLCVFQRFEQIYALKIGR